MRAAERAEDADASLAVTDCTRSGAPELRAQALLQVALAGARQGKPCKSREWRGHTGSSTHRQQGGMAAGALQVLGNMLLQLLHCLPRPLAQLVHAALQIPLELLHVAHDGPNQASQALHDIRGASHLRE